MKKILALTFFIGFFTTSFAQSNYEHFNDTRDDQYAATFRQGYYHHELYLSPRERDFEIARIDREFRMKVYSIRRSRFMRHHQKKLAIRSAEYERARQIEMVNARFENQVHYGYERR
ncbi:MAG TPA: hypothetical protein VMU83_19115 [Hanamia sp.]|nr:hypothetical protein [Hanamia sp.]